jgi:SecD/SecF fusion protein
MSDTIYKLQLRAQTYSTEAEVYKVGSNRISVDIPSVTDANEVLEELGQPGSLSFLDKDGTEVLTGTDVQSAQAGIRDKSSGGKEYLVQLTFSDEGSEKFAEVTAAQIGEQISIVYDGKTVSSPTVQSAITGGQCEITGLESYEEAETLASTIRIGALPLGLEEISSEVVGAKLGQEAISTSLKAGAIGFALVLLFMLVVYGVLGIAADLALALYVTLLIFLLSAFQVTLTLPGIAGMILSIGMAVDANVIIFSRIREELAAGRSVDRAITEGFRNARSAILDGNITTLIAAFVLWWRGTGTVKGFAQTLAMGIILSMFTALLITKFIIKGLYNLGVDQPKTYGYKPENRDKPVKVLKIMQKRKIWFTISALVIIIGIGAMVYNGTNGSDIFNYSLEFKGGTSTTVDVGKDLTLDEIQSEVVPIFSEITGDNDIQTQKVTDSTQIVVKTKTLDLDQRTELTNNLIEKYEIDESAITTTNISAVVSDEMKSDAIIAVLIATVAMLIYIWFRFSGIMPAASAIIALVHDVLVVLTCYAVFRWTVGNTFIACILTLVGYSINDSIVILDRIRENRQKMKKGEDEEELFNLSLTQTIGRSINTSFTTALMVLVLLILGVSSIREFAMPLLVGVICGTYSSICLVASTYYMMRKKKQSK